jgi:hypothetical protein
MEVCIDGVLYSEGQLRAALRCSDWVLTTYAAADEANGGGGSLNFDTLDYAFEAACEAYDLEEYNHDAKAANGLL